MIQLADKDIRTTFKLYNVCNTKYTGWASKQVRH